MKRVIEISAKSHEEANELARREVHAGETISSSEILQEPTRGIFGIVGNPEVRIRFSIEDVPAPIVPPPLVSAPAYQAPPPRPAPPLQPAPQPRTVASSQPGEEEMDNFSEEDAPSCHAAEEGSSEQNPGGGRVRQYTGPTGTAHPAYEEIHGMVRNIAEIVGAGEVVIEDHMEGDAWKIEPIGENMKQFIGKHGRTLDAIQYLVNIVANKGREDKVKIVIDTQGYRESRNRRLISLANRMCRKVDDTGRPVELEPMSTIDRRTVHLALKDRQGIQTFSRGTEPMRRVVIAPQKGASERPFSSDRHEPRPYRQPRQNNEPRTSAESPGTRSVPMFMEEDPSND